MFWTVLSDLPKLSLMKFLQIIWNESGESNQFLDGMRYHPSALFCFVFFFDDCFLSLIELYHWKGLNHSLKSIEIGYSPSEANQIIIKDFGCLLFPRFISYPMMLNCIRNIIENS